MKQDMVEGKNFVVDFVVKTFRNHCLAILVKFKNEFVVTYLTQNRRNIVRTQDRSNIVRTQQGALHAIICGHLTYNSLDIV